MKNTIFRKMFPLFSNRSGHLLNFNAIYILIYFFFTMQIFAGQNYISKIDVDNAFPLVADGQSAPLCISTQDYPGVLRVAGHMQSDIKNVTDVEPKIIRDKVSGNIVVIIGTIGKNPVIDNLIQEKKINATAIAGKWDTFALQTVENPLPDVDRALVIFGSNKRGTIYGMYDLSSKIGV